MQVVNPPRYPVWPLLLSSAAAALAVCAALWLTRPTPQTAWEDSTRLASTPERVAEGFVQAYRMRAYGRAASLATGPLAANLRRRPSAPNGARRAPDDGRRFLLQESHWLPKDRLRLVGALLRNDDDEAAAPTLNVLLTRKGTRWLVDEVEGGEVLEADPKLELP
jgi:hypothetical protein